MKKKYLLLAACLGAMAHCAAADNKPAAPAPAGSAATFSGKVVETTNASTYTYVLVDTGKAKLWAAAPRFKAAAGDAITVSDASPMPRYHSRLLNRDFDLVYFTGTVVVNGVKPEEARVPALPANHPNIGHDSQQTVDLTGIKRAEGGQTVGEIFADKAKLAGKSVKVRGKVARYNSNILGKNWLHLKDGTGTRGGDDLMVTTEAELKLGDTVLITGKLATDKDFGAGYKYSVIVEDAKVTVE